MTQSKEIQLMKELEQFDTPTITNVIATYPANQELCLGLYNPQQVNWYTDQNLKCMYPRLGPRCGYAVTAVYGMMHSMFNRLEFYDILAALAETGGPSVLLLKENFDPLMKQRNALLGGNMMTAFKQLGVVGVIGDAPMRDIDEMRPMEVQCLFPGVVAGHGTAAIEAVNVPVHICGMDTAPGEIIHMDENGAVKFPAGYLAEILIRATKMRQYDQEKQAVMQQTSDPRKLADIMKGLYR